MSLRGARRSFPFLALLVAACSSSSTSSGGDASTTADGSTTSDASASADGGKMSRLDPAQYSQACDLDADCQVVFTYVCLEEGCGCQDGAVRKSEAARYQADFDAAHARCASLQSCRAAAACAATVGRCRSNTCVSERFDAAPPSDAGGGPG